MLNNASAAFSTNNGNTWTTSIGGPVSGSGSYRPVADKVNSTKFYIMQPSAGTLWKSENGGALFTVGATSLPTSSDVPAAVPGYEGNLWMPAWSNGLWISTDSGATFTKIANVQEGYRVGFGKAAPDHAYPAVYIWGTVAGTAGFFRSDDIGVTWTRINDDMHQYGYINQLIGDPRVYGRVFIATSGRGIIYGQPEGVLADDEIPDPNDPVFNVPLESVVYIDSYQAPWKGDGWGFGALTFNNATPVHAGVDSIKVTFNQSWGVFRLSSSVFNVGKHQNLEFWIHGGDTGGQGVSVTARLAGDVWLNAYKIPQSSLVANTWTKITIPLATLGLSSTDDIIGFAIGNYGFTPSTATPTQPTFYIDDIVVF
jgi:hypothetical protein